VRHVVCLSLSGIPLLLLLLLLLLPPAAAAAACGRLSPTTHEWENENPKAALAAAGSYPFAKGRRLLVACGLPGVDGGEVERRVGHQNRPLAQEINGGSGGSGADARPHRVIWISIVCGAGACLGAYIHIRGRERSPHVCEGGCKRGSRRDRQQHWQHKMGGWVDGWAGAGPSLYTHTLPQPHMRTHLSLSIKKQCRHRRHAPLGQLQSGRGRVVSSYPAHLAALCVCVCVGLREREGEGEGSARTRGTHTNQRQSLENSSGLSLFCGFFVVCFGASELYVPLLLSSVVRVLAE
jgi:hypothetical protein